MKNLKHLFTALLLLCTTMASAYDFGKGGLCYNITDATNRSVEVTTYASSKYSGSVVIPNSVTFNGIGYRVTAIGERAFQNCSDLTSIEIPNSVTSIGKCAFYGCASLTSITLPNNVTKIDEEAFASCYNLTDIKIPNSLTTIGASAFSYCFGLTNIEIPNSVTSIGRYAFYDCSRLISVTIPNSVTSIGEYAFSSCENLKEVHICDLNAWLCLYFPNIYANPLYYARNLYLNGEKITNLVIPDNVTEIKNFAFCYCLDLISIEIPNSVTSIGARAFLGCSNLTSIEIPNSVTSIGDYAFCDCLGLKNITSLITADKLFAISTTAFSYVDKNTCTLYVPYGAKDTYASTAGWSEFVNIVELERPTIEITINKYGNATFCSEYALDFSEVEGLKAYAATGYNSATQVVTLTRVQTTKEETGLFLMGEPGEYKVPVIEYSSDNTLNLLVGTLEQTTVNSTDGAMSNYKFTITDGDEAPMFYPFEDNTTFSAGKAYLQIPTAWLPNAGKRSLSIRFDNGTTTDIEEIENESVCEQNVYYDLQGRKVVNPTNGIYIINGKKVFIK